MIIKKKKSLPQQDKIKETKLVEEIEEKETKSENENDAFDLNNIDFSQRAERRRGDRRRGYRRVDDRNLITRAQQEAIKIKENAIKEGYEYGYECAQDEISKLAPQILEFANSKQKMYEDFSKTILNISLEIAQKIIKKEVEEDKTVLLGMINEVLEEISKDESKITISVNPSELDFARQTIPQLINENNRETKVLINADEKVDMGGAVVLTSNGMIDATIKTQLSVIKEAFKGI